MAAARRLTCPQSAVGQKLPHDCAQCPRKYSEFKSPRDGSLLSFAVTGRFEESIEFSV
jgi:hypothetical protein